MILILKKAIMPMHEMVTHWAPPVLIFQVYFPVWLEEEIYLSFLTLKCCFCKRNSIWNQVFLLHLLSLSLSAILYKGMIFPFQKRRIFYSGPRQWFAAWVALKVIAHSFWFSTLSSSFIARQVCALPCLSITCFQRDLSFSLWPIALPLLQK